MKKMKRLVAILLASVLALAMLTACGEEAPQSLGQRAEKVLMDSLNKAYNTSYENDADLKNKVTAVLNKIDENGEIAATDIPLAYLEGSYNFPGYLEKKDNTYIATYLMVASGSGKKLKALEVTEESLKNATSGPSTSSVEKPDAIGVASIEKNGKTYIGVAMKMVINK
ncbi:MAG: hypothetical protein ACLUQA_11025 [Faecalibacterium sp.]